MIKDIPSKDDFDAVGAALLDQSWEVAATLLTALAEAKQWMGDGAEEEELYWLSASTKLATALAIAHQGAEFMLKGKIAEVSPLLLILNAPKEWPKPGADGNITFSQFRTVDAQDIVRLHDGCAAAPLDRDFSAAFEALRIRRNSVMHSVDPNLKVHAAVLIEEILKIYKTLMPGRNWVDARREALYDSSEAQVWAGDWVEPRMVREFNAIKAALPPKAMLEHFAFDKKRRTYLCANCTFYVCDDENFQSYSATLTTKVPKCDSVLCFICGETDLVERVKCGDEGCKGDVISVEWSRCLTCGADAPAVDE